jgi:hypothetical protein
MFSYPQQDFELFENKVFIFLFLLLLHAGVVKVLQA